jgi:hypothetical protein
VTKTLQKIMYAMQSKEGNLKRMKK